MLEQSFLIAALMQVSPIPPPAPPPAPRPGTVAFESEMERYRNDLREACMSEPGIRIAVEHSVRLREISALNETARRAATREVAEAALTPPIDIERFAAAIKYQTEIRRKDTEDYDSNKISLMRQLSPADRIIFGPRTTILSPATPPRHCPLPRGR